MRKYLLILILSILLNACSQSNKTIDENDKANNQIVNTFIEAFNQRELDQMLATVSTDIEWLSIDGNQISTVTKNKVELEETLKDYFTQCTSCKSKVEKMLSNNTRVSVTEVTSWESEDGMKSQSSLSVYEIDKGLIKRVYYFPEDVVEK